MHLTLNSCVTNLLKMLTYYRVCCAFSSAGALLLSAIYYFSDGFKAIRLYGLTFTPFDYRRQTHKVNHGTYPGLDHRGVGDI
jgi:hypothetical protein